MKKLEYYAMNNLKNYEDITYIPNKKLKFLNSGLSPKSLKGLFYGCSELKFIPRLDIDTSKCAKLNRTFDLCTMAEYISVDYMNTKKVTTIKRVFGSCNSLKFVDVSNWDTSNVVMMDEAFYNCYNLIYADVSEWDTSSVTSMYGVFYNCKSLPYIDVSNWNISNVKTMSDMFFHCESLTHLDLSKWIIKKKNISTDGMFENCSSLVSVDISGWDTSNIEWMEFMFAHCENLEHIEGVIDLKNCSSYLCTFKNCPKLKGVKIKNVPEDFSKVSGLYPNQYEVVE